MSHLELRTVNMLMKNILLYALLSNVLYDLLNREAPQRLAR